MSLTYVTLDFISSLSADACSHAGMPTVRGEPPTHIFQLKLTNIKTKNPGIFARAFVV